MAEHFDTLDADFLRFYGLDLADACWGERAVGLRRLSALTEALPPESATARDGGWFWDEQREMSAILLELAHDTAVSSRALVSAMSGKRFNGPSKPFKFPRPTVAVSEAVEEARPASLDRQAVRQALLGPRRR